MKHVITMCAAVAVGCVLTAAAEAQQEGKSSAPSGVSQPETRPQPQAPGTRTEPGTAQPQPQPQARSAAAGTMYIGCLEKGTTPDSYALVVTEMPPAATAQAGQPGPQPTGTSGASLVGHRITLTGGDDMASRLGQKVEVSGMLVPQGTPAVAGKPAGDMRVNVNNVRMVSATCAAPSASPTRGTSGTSGTTDAPGTTTTEPSPQGKPQPQQPSTQDKPY